MSTFSAPALGQIFDGYSRRARIAPAFIVSMPITFTCVVLIPTLANWNKLWLLATTAGVTVIADHLVRDRGRKLQPELWASWGGPPATKALRHRDAGNTTMLLRRHGQLEKLLDMSMPTRRQEASNPAKADEKYEVAVKYLISRTRDTATYRLIFLENCHYGFRRNMLGVRPTGLAASLTVLAGSIAVLGLSFYGLTIWRLGFCLVASVSLTLSYFWLKVVRPDWVRSAAECYAERLFESLDTLTPIKVEQTPPNTGTGG